MTTLPNKSCLSDDNKNSTLSIARVTAVFASGNLMATALRLVAGVLTSKAVEPAVLGLFNGIGLVTGYVPFFQLGVSNGLNREVPYFHGQGRSDDARLLAETAKAWMLFVTGITVAGILLMAGWMVFQQRYDLALGWLSYSVPVAGVLYGQFYLRILFVTHNEFQRLSMITVYMAAVGLFLVALVWWQDYVGLCVRGFLLGVIMLFLFWRWRPLVVQARWRWAQFKHLVKSGMPIFVVGQLYAWWVVLNSTLVLQYTGAKGLGLYAIANMAGPTVAMIPQALTQVVYQRTSEQYGRTGKIRDLIHIIISPTIIAFGFTLLAVIVAWFAIPPTIALILPKYTEGIKAAQWSVISALVISMTPVNCLFNVVKKQGRYGTAMIFGMFAYYVTLKHLIYDGVYLEAFPQAMILGRLVFVTICFLMISHLVRAEKPNQ